MIMRLEELNALGSEAAEAAFLRCCGSIRWARAMAAARPFATMHDLSSGADDTFLKLGPADWLEAFRAHPRIGESGGAWSAEEQAGMRVAADDVHRKLAAANQLYEAHFGYIFIVCATGKSAGEMLARLESRLTNDPATERRVAAEEQRKITKLRIEKLLCHEANRS
jgi:OHCU decarboxylase